MPAAPKVFVYGTLRQGFDNPGRDVLTTHGELVGEGRVEGSLYDLGSFPALVEDDEAGTVEGEVYRLENEPQIGLQRLDRYEGATGSDPLPYERRERTVQLVQGGDLTAWVYVWTGSTEDADRISSGDWLDREAGR
jgi:gamma-glutamylcyclotransferase (GGCT)/AIG2-like uncharacterized protein YtfP